MQLNAVYAISDARITVEADAVFLHVDTIRLTQDFLLLQISPFVDTASHKHDPNHHEDNNEYIHVIFAQQPKQSRHDEKAET